MPLGRSVDQLTSDSNRLIKRWPKIREAVNQLGADASCISAVCMGRRKTHRGFIWRYVDIDNENEEAWSPVISESFQLYYPGYAVSSHDRVKNCISGRLL